MSRFSGYGGRSLRFKMIAIFVTVQVVILSVFVWNSFRLGETYLIEEAGHRVKELTSLLNVSLAGPLLQGDVARLNEILEQVMDEKGLRYIAVYGADGRKLLVRGEESSKPIQNISKLTTKQLRKHIGAPIATTSEIQIGGRIIGRVRVEMDTRISAEALKTLWHQGLIVGTLEVAFTVLLLSVLGLVVTRHLRTLGDAAKSIAEGNLSVRIPARRRDEIGETALAFNHMAEEISLAQQKLQDRQDRIRLLMDSTAEGIYGLDSKGNCTFANAACVRLLGHISADELVGQNMHQLIHHTRSNGTPHPVEHCLMTEVYITGQSQHIDHTVLWHKDGSNFDAEVWSYPVYKGNELVGAVVTFIDISARKRMEGSLRTLAQNTLVLDSRQFFHETTRQLAETYGTKYAFIGLLTGAKKNRVRTLSVWGDDGTMGNFEYDLAGTPCQYVVSPIQEFIPRAVRQLYPDDKLLVDMKIESYFGTCLYNSTKEVIGLVSVMDVEPMELETWGQSLLGVFATRIAAEHDRKQAEDALRKARQELEQRVKDRTRELSTANQQLEHEISVRRRVEQELRDSETQMRLVTDALPALISYFDSDQRYLFNNRAYQEWFGVSAEEMLGKQVREVVGEDYYRRVRSRILKALSGKECSYDEELSDVRGNMHTVSVKLLPHYDEARVVAGCFAMVTDITERKHAEQVRIRHAEQQRDALVREVHHRIKNSLQGVIGLLQRPLRSHPELAGPLEDVISQMQSIAIVHGIQGDEPGEGIDLGAIVTAICETTGRQSGGVMPVIEHELKVPFSVSKHEAVPIALVLNELVCNAVKHSDVDNGSRPIQVSISSHGGECARIQVFNQKAHLPPHFDYRAGVGLGTGLCLVKSLMPSGSAKLSIGEKRDGVAANLDLIRTPPGRPPLD